MVKRKNIYYCDIVDYFTLLLQWKRNFNISDGIFGAMMQVHIQNDGPVTIEIESPTPQLPQQLRNDSTDER